MALISFTVSNTEARNIQTKFGAKQKFILADEFGNKYEAGWKNPGIPPGAFVEADMEENQYGKQITNIRVKGAGGAAPAPSAGPVAATSARPAEPGFPLNPQSREISIIRQNALTNAVATLSRFPTDDDTSVADFTDKVLEIARKYADYTSGHDILKQLEGEAKP